MYAFLYLLLFVSYRLCPVLYDRVKGVMTLLPPPPFFLLALNGIELAYHREVFFFFLEFIVNDGW